MSYAKYFLVVAVFWVCVGGVVEAKGGLNLVNGAGAAGQVAVWSGVSTIFSDNNFQWDATLGRLTVKSTASRAAVEIENYFKGTASGMVYGIKSSAYANDHLSDVYGGHFLSSSDASVRNSYGIFGQSIPEHREGESVGVYGKGMDAGVKGLGEVGVHAVSYGHTAIISEGNIEVGSSSKPSGITMYDNESGEPFCVQISAGNLNSSPGKCD